jgi:tRNA(fMet)-specific endonuclease VapC
LKYLLDTDWIIDHLNGKREVTSRIESLAKDGIAVSVISVAELFEGVHGSRDYEKSLKALESFLKGFTVINLDVEVCKIFGRERNKLRKIGKTIGDFDLLIGSLCLRHNLVLLTNNKAHFDRIDDLRTISA